MDEKENYLNQVSLLDLIDGSGAPRDVREKEIIKRISKAIEEKLFKLYDDDCYCAFCQHVRKSH